MMLASTRFRSLRHVAGGWLHVLLLLLPLLSVSRAALADAGHADSGAPADGGARATDSGAGTADAGAEAASPAGEPEPPPPTIEPSEAEKADGQPVSSTLVRGTRRVTREEVLSYVRLKPGRIFRVSELANDVRALWDSGLFSDVQAELRREDKGVELTFVVQERPSIRAIEFSGNEEIENDKLLESIDLKPNTILSIATVRRAAQKIKDAYNEKGYFLAEVEDSIVPSSNNEVVVRFVIKEHQQVTVRRITFIGNYNVPDAELRDMMQTGQGSFFSFGSGGAFRQDMFELDVLRIQGLYMDRGYLAVQVATPRVMLTPDREGIDITLSIQEGPRFRIRRLRFYEEGPDGKEVEPLGGRRALLALLRARSGDWFNRAELAKDLQSVQVKYKDAGFARVRVAPQVEQDLAKREVDIVVSIERGPPVTVERIEIKGNSKTRDKVLRREMEIQEGQLFSESKLEESKRRIQALGYFERVDVSDGKGSSPDKIVIYFEVAERPTGTFQVGAGFSSVENFIATAQVQQANLLGNGQSLALQAQLSGLRQLITIRFFEPYFLDSDWSMSTELFDTLYVFPDFSRRSLGGSLTFGYALAQPWLRVSLTATAQHDKVETGATSTLFGATTGFTSLFQRLPLANLFNDGRTISIRPAITYDTRDNRLFPTSGLFVQASTELASGTLGSEIEFLRHRFTGRFYQYLGGGSGTPGSGFVFKINTEVGVVTSPHKEGVPIFARFFLGGILDVRGYRLRTIGPRLPLNTSLDVNAAPIAYGANIGGNLQAYTNIELEFPILDKVGIRGVAFFDAGNAWNLEDQFCRTTPAPQFSKVVSPCWDGAKSLTYLRTSTGFGIRWFSPLGPLRFEWGFPIRPLYYEEPSVFEFTIGNFF